MRTALLLLSTRALALRRPAFVSALPRRRLCRALHSLAESEGVDASWSQWDWQAKGHDPVADAAAAEAAGAAALAADAIQADSVERAIAALAPFVSDARAALFERVLDQRSASLRVVFERPSNPNNVWACLRTIDSFGLQYVDLVAGEPAASEPAAEPAAGIEGAAPRRGAVRAENRFDDGAGRRTWASRDRLATMSTALGSQKWLTLREHASAADAVAALRAEGYEIIATDLADGATPIDEFDWRAPPAVGGAATAAPRVALVFGNEEQGITPQMRALCDRRVFVPMKGFAESFNLSVACAVALASITAAGGVAAGDLAAAERRRLLLRWMMLSVKNAQPLLRRAGVELPSELRKTHSTVLGFTTRT